MKKLIFFSVLLSLLFLACSPKNASAISNVSDSMNAEIIVKNVNVISMVSNAVTENQSVIIRDGKIQQIANFSQLKPSKNAVIIDGKGKYLMPGLADMHVHLPELSKLDLLLKMNIAAGITHIRVMNSEVSRLDLTKKLSETGIISPNVHFSHLVKKDIKYSESQFDSLILEVKKSKIDFIKLLGLSDEPTFDNLMKSARKNNVMVCGHYPKFTQFGKGVAVKMDKVLGSGFRSIEHLGGYDGLENDAQLAAAIKQTKEQKVYNCPTLDYDIVAAELLFPDGYKKRLTYSLLPNSMVQKWEKEHTAEVEKAGVKEQILELQRQYKPVFDKKTKILKQLADNGCLLLVGSDPASNFQANGFNVYEEMRNWSNIGIDNFTILKSATTSPAQFFNQEKQWGTIETGKEGNVILLDKNPLLDINNISTISTTILNGKIYEKAKMMGQE